MLKPPPWLISVMYDSSHVNPHLCQAMFDGLWPFALAYSQNRFSRWYEGAAIYVLDIGLYLLPLLRTVFPNLTFISFTSASAVPSNAEPVDLTGIGMASFSSLSEPPSNSTGLSKFFDLLLSPFNFPRLSVIRDIVYQQLNLTSLPQCIVLVSRVMSPSKLSAFHARHSLDQSRESHDLKPFHDLGPFVHTAMYYLQSTAHERRGIQNEHLLFRQLIKIFNKKFGICVKHVELSTLSIRQQFELFATAKIVIAQHGAALAYAPFMPNDPSDPGIVLELLPLINPTFHLTCNAMGVKHQFLDRSTHSELYLSDDNNFLEIDAKALVRLVAEQLEGWKAPSLGKVYNLTTANDISSPSDPEISPSIATMESTCSLSSTENIPEWGYVHSTIDLNDQPFVWRDSLHDLKDSPWLNLTFKDWEKRMKR